MLGTHELLRHHPLVRRGCYGLCKNIHVDTKVARCFKKPCKDANASSRRDLKGTPTLHVPRFMFARANFNTWHKNFGAHASTLYHGFFLHLSHAMHAWTLPPRLLSRFARPCGEEAERLWEEAGTSISQLRSYMNCLKFLPDPITPSTSASIRHHLVV